MRDARFLSQAELAEISGVSVRSVANAEADATKVAWSTVKALLGGLAVVAPFTSEESFVLTETLALGEEHLVDAMERAKARRRETGAVEPARARTQRALQSLGPEADALADLLDSVVALCRNYAKRTQQELLARPDLPEVIRTMSNRVFFEAVLDRVSPGDTAQDEFEICLPGSIKAGQSMTPLYASVPSGERVMVDSIGRATHRPKAIPAACDTVTLRVVITEELLPNGTSIQHRNYYTPDGTRLVPVDDLPPPPPQVTVRPTGTDATKKPRTK